MAQVHFFALSDRWIGGVNTDAFCAEMIGKYHVFAVAEGLSDLPGEVSASGIAISCLREIVESRAGSPSALLGEVVRESEARIISSIARSQEQAKDATLLCACLVDENLGCTILDVGEGNAYLIDADRIVPAREYQIPSRLAPAPAESDEKKRALMISHTLGEPRMLRSSDILTIPIRDRFLLISSGGLHDFVAKETIREIVMKNGENVETSCEQLREEALRAGSERTITLVIVHGHYH